MVDRRVGPDEEDEFGMRHVAQRIADRAGTDALHQRGHTGRVTQTRAMVHVVGMEGASDQLLEQVGLFVGALGGTEAGHRRAASLHGLGVAHPRQALGRERERFVPRGFTELRAQGGGIGPPAGALGENGRVFRGIAAAHQRHGQPVRVVGVIEPETPLDTEPAVVRRASATLHTVDALVLHVVGELTAHAAVWADGIDLPFGHAGVGAVGRSNGPGRAGLHAFATGHAGALTHRVTLVEDDLHLSAPERQAQHVVALHVAAGADAARALDARVQADRHGWMAGIRPLGGHLLLRRPTCREALAIGVQPLGPLRQLTVVLQAAGVGRIGLQQFQHGALGALHAGGVGAHGHAGLGRAAARRRQHALPFHLHHAGAAVARRGQARLVAQVRNGHPQALGHLPHAFAGQGLGGRPVQGEIDQGQIGRAHACTSCGKNRSTLSKGLGAAWPSPQMDASRITCDRSPRRSASHTGACINTAACVVPARQGVH